MDSCQKFLNRRLILLCSHWVIVVAANTHSIHKCCVAMGNSCAPFHEMRSTTVSRTGMSIKTSCVWLNLHYFCESGGFLELFINTDHLSYWLILSIYKLRVKRSRVSGGGGDTLPVHFCITDHGFSVLAGVKLTSYTTVWWYQSPSVLSKDSWNSVFHLCRARVKEWYTCYACLCFDVRLQQAQVCYFSGNFAIYMFIILNNI
jgi:hypothetical protein